MKKTYITPAIHTKTVRLTHIMAGSGNEPNYDPNGSFSDESGVGAKQGGFDWGSSDEDESQDNQY